ncbi:hypothetical protein J2S43_005250 [Catenuloplanes nepalensis]|uniref:Uncharacterized protein n=1 Tax=Catenuloplanes nepalensis TaxID=587533 RepID=A0ABT9MZ69_9ACTN|nr:hypothetical protein [Catenuloplanes nepalensis]MDP9796738.1 hypothetical protein [Catenuloplanes nepalensis]
MPGNKPHEAFNAFTTPLVDALECVTTHPRMEFSAGGSSILDQKHNLLLVGRQLKNDGYLRLGRSPFELRARLKYMLIKDDRENYGPLRVTTCGYDYSIRTTDGAAVLDYHWHPTGLSHEKRPHVHIGSAQLRSDAVLSSKRHVYTGRVTFEAVVRELIELGVEPMSKDWGDLLDMCETPHLLHRSWHHDYESETGRNAPPD